MVAWYRDVLALPQHAQMGEGAFHVGPAALLIDGHSEIRGTTQEPARILINLFVEDLAAEQSRLEAQGVTFIRTDGTEYWGGHISTMLDPDGNYVQLIEFRPG